MRGRGVMLLVISLLACAYAKSLMASSESPFIAMGTFQANTPVESVCFSPDSTLLLVVSGAGATEFVIATGMAARSFPNVHGTASYSPDGMAIADNRGVVNVASGSRIWSQFLWGTPRFSPDGTLVAGGYDPVSVWKVGDWSRVRDFYPAQTRSVAEVGFSSDGTTLHVAETAWGDAALVAWDITTGTKASALELSVWSDTTRLDFSSDCSTFVGISSDIHGYRIRVWDVASGNILSTVPLGGTAEMFGDAVLTLVEVRFAGGSRLVALAVGNLVRVYTLPSGRLLCELAGDPIGIQAMAVSSDGEMIAVAGRSGRVDLWDISPLLAYSCSGFAISKVDWKKGCVTIKNTTSTALDLLGWSLSDGDKSYMFTNSVVVAAGESYVLCPAVYNPGDSSRALTIDETDEAVSLYTPEICGSAKESTKRQ